MINAQELRIGNWVYYLNDANPIKIDGVSDTDALHMGEWDRLEMHYAIPLTPEWLERFGFELDHMGKRPYRIEIPEVCTLSATQNGFSDTGAWWLSMKSEHYSQPVTIIAHHVHELQNLYRVIAGKELELKTAE